MVRVNIPRAEQAQRDTVAWRDSSIATECTRWNDVREACDARHAEGRMLEEVTPRRIVVVHLFHSFKRKPYPILPCFFLQVLFEWRGEIKKEFLRCVVCRVVRWIGMSRLTVVLFLWINESETVS